jgi:hypothetical protein
MKDSRQKYISNQAPSQLYSIHLLLYNTIIKPIWTYGIQLWSTASTSNIEILERFQSKVLGIILDAPWYVPNSLIRRDLSCPTVKEEIRVTALTMLIDFAPIPIISQQTFFGCLTTDVFAGFCLLICLTDSNELFFLVNLVISYLLVSLVPY